MATKKDLVEAYSFSRRRLVTAFVSGAPGGREVEPTRPGRTLIGGVALAVLLVAGALVLGIIKSPNNVDWEEQALISEKETGADYVNLVPLEGGDPELRPVINITSAMLLLGADVSSTSVSAEEIGTRTRGEPIGILQAPATPPRADTLLQSGWTACVGAAGGPAQGIQVGVSAEPAVTPTPDTRFVVRTADGRLFVIAESALGWNRSATRAYAYPVDTDNNADRLLRGVAGNGEDEAVPVPNDWVTLFPRGGLLGLATLGLKPGRIGRQSEMAGASTVPTGARIGDVLTVVDGDLSFLLLDNSILQLDPFSLAVYSNSYPRGGAPTKREIAGPPATGVSGDARSLPAAYWPTTRPIQTPSGSLCAMLDAVPGDDPGVHVARADFGSDAAPDDLPADEIDRAVESGSGAFVQAGDWDSVGAGTMTLVDDRGLAYRVEDDIARTNLGYAGVDDEVVPSSWLQLFERGVVLSLDASRCPPTSRDTDKTCADE